MASSILIPLKAIFDDKGIKEAQTSFGKLGSSMKGLLGAAGLAVGLSSVISGLKSAAQAAAEDAKSQALLATQLRNTTGATNAQIATAEAAISAMQTQAAVADDTIRPAMAALTRATGDLGTATKLTSLALDVSAGTGKDVQSVAVALGKAYQGNTTALARMGINVKGMKDPLIELAKQFDGAAEAAAKTDPLQRLEIMFGELSEQVGLALLPQLNEFADWMADPVHAQEATNLAQTVGGAFATILTEVAGLIEGLAVVGWSMNNLFTDPMEVFKVLSMTIGEGYDYIMAKQNEAMKNGKKVYKGLTANEKYLLGQSKLSGGITGTTTTAGGNSKAAAAAKAAADKAAKARQAIIDAAQKAADEAEQAFEELKATIDSFNKSFEATAQGFNAVFKLTPVLGAFEQQAVDAFDTIKQAAQDAFDSKLIAKDALASLTAYADQEKALLQGIAKQRDVLAKKISIAQSVTSGIMGSLNITAMLQTETKQVTKSVTKMIDGIALTTTQTFDEVVSGGLADSFKKLVDKTKAFASNLTKLKSLGLNGNLFKQIVDAGAEGGNATAEAIIAGGAEAVTELNGLFRELSDAGASIAETTTPVLYALGEDITNSFIEGLRSEDQKLIDTATAMASLFTAEFKKQLDLAITPTLTAMQSTGVQAQSALDLSKRPDPKRSPQSYAAWLQSIGGIDPVRSPESYARSQTAAGATYNITVEAGLIANKQEIPAMIVDALGTYTRQSGAGGLVRILGI
jgi:hypothetical protein